MAEQGIVGQIIQIAELYIIKVSEGLKNLWFIILLKFSLCAWLLL